MIVGVDICSLVKVLPESKKLAADVYDATEVLDVIKHAGITCTVTDPKQPTFEMAVVAALSKVSDILIKAPPGRTFPDQHADRLGQEIAKLVGGSGSSSSAPPPPRFPLAEKLKSIATSDAEWIDFLKRSVKYTYESDRHEASATCDFLKMGAVESYLKKANVTIKDIENIGATPQSADSLMAMLAFDLKPDAVSSKSVDKNSGNGININVNPHPDLKGSGDDRRFDLTLREDFDALNADDTVKAQLELLHANVLDPASLATAVRSLDDKNPLKRLVTTERDIEKSLAGARPLPFLIHACGLHPESIRHAIPASRYASP
ncbi:MAG: hypothetical protein CBC48_05650 [bacterium TMED88]|nr:MAG: hypothetical protein CBC48_05650 [bacterium TMED88]